MADGGQGVLLGRNGTGPVPEDVSRAVAHMRSALAEPITMADLVRAAGVPARTLHRHFVAFLGAPPLAYLRRLRLASAREALLAARNGTSVTEIAARTGCAHQGRFAVEYRRCFGEAPSATLARARAGAGRAIPLVPRHRTSLAILPFRTETGRHEDRAFAESLAEQLAATLAGMQAVSVRLARQGPGAPSAGDRYCLTGYVVRTAGGRVRVIARLIDHAENDAHLWGDAYDGDAAGLLALQDRVARGAAGAIERRVEDAEIERALRKPDGALTARDLVLRAMPLVLGGDPGSATRALGLLEDAIDLAPDDPAPVALAAWCRTQRAMYDAVADPRAEYGHAARLAARAGALDPLGDPLVLTARSSVAMAGRRREEADLLNARARAIAPRFGWAWERHAWTLVNYGEPVPALRRFRRALSLKGPRAPRSNCLVGLAAAHTQLGQYAQALACHREALAANPDAVWTHRVSLPCHIMLGEWDAARASADRLREACPHVTVERVACPPAICNESSFIAERLAPLGLPREGYESWRWW